MARVAAPVNKDRLTAALKLAEQDGPRENRKALWIAVTAIYNAGRPAKPITPAVAQSRAKAWKLPVRTPVATAGRPKGARNRPKPPGPRTRDDWGRLVRETWIRWARTQPDPKPSWLVPYDELSEPDREADRMIGEAVARAAREELNRLYEGLGRIVQPDAIGPWLETPNPAFNGLKPSEVIRRGQSEKVWQMIHEIEQNTAF